MKKKLFILINFIFLLIFSISISVKAVENIYSNVIPYNKALLDETNTFNGKLEEKTTPKALGSSEKYTYLSPSYFFSARNNNAVDTDEPKITFITHGLSGSYHNWLNENLYNGSIVDELNQSTSCDFYIAEIKKDDSVLACDLKRIVINDKAYVTEGVNCIENTPRHIVILFSASKKSSGNVNDYVYSEFNYVASVVIKQLKDYDPEHKLPRVNLIGHSRGGLTNLQFALDHPDLVDSMYSLGTPYLGTTMASVHKMLNEKGLFAESFAFQIGEADIICEDTYNDYYNRWNNNYDELYKNINVIALGSYCDLDFLLYSLIYFASNEFHFPMFTKEEYTT